MRKISEERDGKIFVLVLEHTGAWWEAHLESWEVGGDTPQCVRDRVPPWWVGQVLSLFRMLLTSPGEGAHGSAVSPSDLHFSDVSKP